MLALKVTNERVERTARYFPDWGESPLLDSLASIFEERLSLLAKEMETMLASTFPDTATDLQLDELANLVPTFRAERTDDQLRAFMTSRCYPGVVTMPRAAFYADLI